METERTCYPYQGYTITTLRHEDGWWASARLATKEAGGDRPVYGGPWKSQAEAQRAAEAFCNSGRAG